MTTTLAVANQKGGVAKTTTVASIGAALAELGQRVLLVDLDPQACLTFSLGIDPEDLELSIHHVLTKGLDPAEVVIETDDGVDLLPATIELARAEADLLTRTGREHVLKGALDDLAETTTYDWVLLDCPPSLGVLTVAALTAADGVLIPLQCETLSHRGVGQLLDTVHDVRRFTNRGLEVWGVLPTLYDGRTNHARAVLETISDTYDLEVIGPPIPKTIKFAEAPAAGRSILATSRSSKGARAYREVAETLMARQHAAARRRRRREHPPPRGAASLRPDRGRSSTLAHRDRGGGAGRPGVHRLRHGDRRRDGRRRGLHEQRDRRPRPTGAPASARPPPPTTGVTADRVGGLVGGRRPTRRCPAASGTGRRVVFSQEPAAGLAGRRERRREAHLPGLGQRDRQPAAGHLLGLLAVALGRRRRRLRRDAVLRALHPGPDRRRDRLPQHPDAATACRCRRPPSWARRSRTAASGRRTPDAIALWNFAPDGTKVVVVA